MDINLESAFLSEIHEKILYCESVKVKKITWNLAICSTKLFYSNGKEEYTYEWADILGAKLGEKSKHKKLSLICFSTIDNKRRYIKHEFTSENPEKLHKIIQHMSFLGQMPEIYDSTYSKKFKVIINPNSGRGRSQVIWARVSDLFGGCEVDITYTQYRNHATEIISELKLSEYYALIVVSGDGLVHEAINALCNRPDGDLARLFPVGVIPAGSANALAQVVCEASGLPVTAESCGYLAVKGQQSPMDISKVTFLSGKVVFSFLCVFWAYIADVDLGSDSCRCCGPCRFDIYGFWRMLFLRRYEGKLTWDDGEYSGRIIYFIACNTPFIGTGMNAAPKAQIDDGMNDLVLLGNVSRMELTRVLLRQDAGTHVNLDYVTYLKTSKWTLQPGTRKGVYSIDGESYQVEDIEVEVLHKYSTVFLIS